MSISYVRFKRYQFPRNQTFARIPMAVLIVGMINSIVNGKTVKNFDSSGLKSMLVGGVNIH